MWIILISVNLLFFLFIFLYTKWKLSGFALARLNQLAENRISTLEKKIEQLERTLSAGEKNNYLKFVPKKSLLSRTEYIEDNMIKEEPGHEPEGDKLEEKVRNLAANGLSASEISKKLNISQVEVELIISFISS